jgi:hypothetical protein
VIASLATGPRPVFLLRGAVLAEQLDDRGVLDGDVLTGKVPVANERNLMSVRRPTLYISPGMWASIEETPPANAGP